MLLQLTLQNFKKHEHLVVDFTDGLNGIYGRSYRGKTTIFYGILFALGGSSQVPGNRVERIGGGRMMVELVAQIGGEVYKVVRTKTTANLYCGDELIATSASAVTNKIEELIGMPLKEWRELHFAKQKSAHALLRYSANNLHQLVRRLNGADQLDSISKQLAVMLTQSEAKADAYEVSAGTPEAIAEDKLALQASQAKVKQLAEAGEPLQAAVNELQQRVDGLMAQRREVSAGLEEQRAFATRCTAGLNAVAIAVTRVDAAERRLAADQADLEALPDPDSVSYEAAKAAVDAMDGALDKERQAAVAAGSAQTRMEEASAELAGLQKAAIGVAAGLHMALDNLAAGLDVEYEGADDYADLLQEGQNRLQEGRLKIGELRLSARQLAEQKDSAVCRTCNRPLDDHDPASIERELASVQQETAALQERTDALEALVTDLTTAKGKADRAAEQIRSAREKGAELRASYESRRQAAVGAEEAAKKAEGEAMALLGAGTPAEARERVTALKTASETRARLSARLQEAKKELEEVTAGLARATEHNTAGGYTLQASNEVEQKIAAAVEKAQELAHQETGVREQLGAAQQSMQNHGRDLHQAQLDVQRLQQRVDNAEQAMEKAIAEQKRVAKIRALQKYLKANAESFMAKVWEAFLARASRFVSQCTGGDISELRRTPEGAFVFVENDAEMNLDEASGAQEAIIGLAIQLSLAQAAPCQLNVLMLDEPTADMDPSCSIASVATMGQMGQQVVFISHHQDDNVLCNNSVVLG